MMDEASEKQGLFWHMKKVSTVPFNVQRSGTHAWVFSWTFVQKNKNTEIRQWNGERKQTDKLKCKQVKWAQNENVKKA